MTEAERQAIREALDILTSGVLNQQTPDGTATRASLLAEARAITLLKSVLDGTARERTI